MQESDHFYLEQKGCTLLSAMINSKSQEAISEAYLMAIAAQINVTINPIRHDESGFDVSARKDMKMSNGISCITTLEIQLKSTSSLNEYHIDNQEIRYALKAENYRKLIEKSTFTKCLALLILPTDEKDWVASDVDKLIIKRCMYWVSLDGLPEVSNKETVTISIPTSHFLDSISLENLLQKTADGQKL